MLFLEEFSDTWQPDLLVFIDFFDYYDVASNRDETLRYLLIAF